MAVTATFCLVASRNLSSGDVLVGDREIIVSPLTLQPGEEQIVGESSTGDLLITGEALPEARPQSCVSNLTRYFSHCMPKIEGRPKGCVERNKKMVELQLDRW